MTSQLEQYSVEVFDSNSTEWLERPSEQIVRKLSPTLFTFELATETSYMLLRHDAAFIKLCADPQLRPRHVRVKRDLATPTPQISGRESFCPPECHDVARCPRRRGAVSSFSSPPSRSLFATQSFSVGHSEIQMP